MLLMAVMAGWAMILGLSPGLAIVVAAIGILVMDAYDPSLLDRVTGRP